MEKELREAIEAYRERLAEHSIKPPLNIHPDEYYSETDAEALRSCHVLLARALHSSDSEARRLLGVVQGILISRGIMKLREALPSDGEAVP